MSDETNRKEYIHLTTSEPFHQGSGISEYGHRSTQEQAQKTDNSHPFSCILLIPPHTFYEQN